MALGIFNRKTGKQIGEFRVRVKTPLHYPIHLAGGDTNKVKGKVQLPSYNKTRKPQVFS